MGMADNLKSIISRQKEVLSELEAECQALEGSDLTKENDELKSRLQKLTDDYLSAKENLDRLLQENSGLKNALYEQVYNERLAILNHSKQKLDVYFKSNYENELNRLLALEYRVKSRIEEMTKALEQSNTDTRDEIYKKLDELKTLIDEKVTLAKAQMNKYSGVFSENEQAEFESLKNEQITDNMIKENAKKNNIESFVGLNLINKLGIFLIVIGVIVASQYTYLKMPDIFKAIAMFTLGAVMLVVGEILNRKNPNVFSLGITAGGVAVLYVALATSYFGLEIEGFDMYPAITLCVLITAGAFVLATRYNAQVILMFALIGGYLPMFSVIDNKDIIYGAMVYFVLLNLLALIISFKKKWRISAFIGLILNIIGTVLIISQLPYGLHIGSVFGILYIIFAFSIYTLIPVISTYTQKLTFKKSDVTLLAINTFFSSITMYFAFDKFRLEKYNGLLAIIFALVYLLLGRIIETKFSGEKNTRALFYLTGFAFVVLIIPLQFDKAFYSLGWLAEGVALASYGIIKNEKSFKKSGLIIGALCVGAFLIVDVLGKYRYLFGYKYLAITLGSLIILGSFIYKKTLSTKFEKVYKYLCIINLWIYGIYVSVNLIYNLWFNSIYDRDGVLYLIQKDVTISLFDISYLTQALAIVLTFLIAYSAPRIRILSDTGVKIISILMYAYGILWLFGLNSRRSPIGYITPMPILITIVGTAILLIISLLSVFALYDLMKCIVMERKLGVEWFPLVVSGYFVLILTQNLITQYNLAFSNAAISIICVLTALAWIILGFVKRYAFLRRFGLGLSILAVAKLFLVDLASLTKGLEIVSYFALGITLVGISFVYQYFNKRLELNISNVKEDM
ncbi:MAG: hypothetical protein BWY15_00948 [Firmicutes bacterium ADurb.Bin193]|nr:MAG: hypothetical protein BWY15_00948 [Firmicutes bacterium ADurb.Bin193]